MKFLNKPLYFVISYLVFVIFLYFFGPIYWQTHNEFLLIVYYILILLSVIFAYLLSSKLTNKRKKYNSFHSLNYKEKWLSRAKKVSIIYVVWKVISMMNNYGGVIGLLNTFFLSIKNPSEAYYAKLQSMQMGTNYFKLFVSTVSRPFLYIYTMNTLYYKKNKNDVMIVSILILVDILSWILQGTNKGLFDILIIFITLWLFSTKKINYTRIQKIKVFCFTFILTILSLFLFNKFIAARIGVPNIYRKNGSYLKPEYFIQSYFGNGFYFFMVYLSSYLTQGIYALSIALNSSISTFTFGFGHSWFLLNIYEKIFKLGSLREKTYVYALQQYNLDPYVNWHSLMTWWFSDFGKIGSLLVLMFFSVLLFKHFNQALDGNIFSLSLYPLILTVFIFLPANNQVFSFVESFFSFWFIYILSLRMNYIGRCRD